MHTLAGGKGLVFTTLPTPLWPSEPAIKDVRSVATGPDVVAVHEIKLRSSHSWTTLALQVRGYHRQDSVISTSVHAVIRTNRCLRRYQRTSSVRVRDSLTLSGLRTICRISRCIPPSWCVRNAQSRCWICGMSHGSRLEIRIHRCRAPIPLSWVTFIASSFPGRSKKFAIYLRFWQHRNRTDESVWRAAPPDELM